MDYKSILYAFDLFRRPGRPPCFPRGFVLVFVATNIAANVPGLQKCGKLPIGAGIL